jgi:hypothetical protein
MPHRFVPDFELSGVCLDAPLDGVLALPQVPRELPKLPVRVLPARLAQHELVLPQVPGSLPLFLRARLVFRQPPRRAEQASEAR